MRQRLVPVLVPLIFMHVVAILAIGFSVLLVGRMASAQLEKVSLFNRAPDHHQCGQSRIDGVDFQWCIDRTPGSRSRDVVYNLHGAGGSAADWASDPLDRELADALYARTHDVPTVLSVSWGPYWFLTDNGGNEPQRKFFVDKVMPYLERKIGGVRGRRIVKGTSMGGFNALQLATKSPEAFDKAILICPVLPLFTPQSSDDEIEQWISESGEATDRDLVWGLVRWLREDFATPEAWAAHDPFERIEGLGRLPTYLTCGDEDQYGFYGGAERFASLAKQKKLNVQWQSLRGGHCVIDAAAVAAQML